MSPPAQKARSPVPRISTARTSGSSAHCRSIGARARYIPSVKAFNACGRFKVTVATPSSCPNRMSSVSAIRVDQIRHCEECDSATKQSRTASLESTRLLRFARNDRWGLQREHQEGVDLLAVEDDEALDKAKRRAAHIDAVEIAAGGEEARLAVMHDAGGEKVRARFGDAVFHDAEPGRADDVAIAVRLEDVGPPHRHDAIDQHAARGAVDDAVTQPGLMALSAGD